MIDDDEAPRKYTPEELAKLSEALVHFPPRELQCIVWHVLGGIDQITLARMLGIAQNTLHYRVQKSLRRMEWILGAMRLFSATDIRRDLGGLLHPRDLEVFALVWETTNETRTAATLHLTRPQVCKILRRLAERELPEIAAIDPNLCRYADGLQSLLKNGLGKLANYRSKWYPDPPKSVFGAPPQSRAFR